MKNGALRVVSTFCALSLGVPLTVPAQEALEDGWERCVNTRQIKRTAVIGDQSIIFYMSGKVIYHNSLPRRCPGLGVERRFTYRSSVGKLCQIDSITVLRGGGSALDRGASCRLGQFRRIDAEQAQMIEEKTDQVPEARPVPPPEPQPFPPPDAEEPGKTGDRSPQ